MHVKLIKDSSRENYHFMILVNLDRTVLDQEVKLWLVNTGSSQLLVDAVKTQC